jgi:hypothetical protein
VACILTLASIITCDFGMSSAVRKIPPERRAKMSDTDWVGAEWALAAFLGEAGALAIGTTGGILLFLAGRRGQRCA